MNPHNTPFTQDPNKYDADLKHAKKFKATPGIDANGNPAVVLRGNRNITFLPETEALRIANEIADILTQARTRR